MRETILVVAAIKSGGARSTPVGHTSRENSETETGLTLGSVFSSLRGAMIWNKRYMGDASAQRNGTSLFSALAWEKIMRGDKLCSCALICGPQCEPY
jgi:hypothetical protein